MKVAALLFLLLTIPALLPAFQSFGQSKCPDHGAYASALSAELVQYGARAQRLVNLCGAVTAPTPLAPWRYHEGRCIQVWCGSAVVRSAAQPDPSQHGLP
ncbi:hypothetical protein PtrM4_022860 [Pyrenophora tritici-repentis]|uniref:Uncharacterized protein n=1 Tax=Pyrenophora tritici-repentis TaxID=45151 RepID=A0A834VVC5_9PLEO|nr:hypothetical protein PtrM4_022860 [Pyrenophora tritici-repentis]